jgi:SAM-dependent methyltransferase
MMSVDRFVRKLVPSVATVSRNRALMAVLDVLDRGISLPFPEFRSLPPNRFRIRVGVGNRILFNQAYYISYSFGTWMYLLSEFTNLSAQVIDIGCGCGRTAYAVRDNPEFTGHYTGIDVDREMITWCKKHFPTERFTFLHADVFSSIYNPLGSREQYKLPLANEVADLVFSQSLFTHLLEGELTNYVSESYRVLREGKVMVMGVFCVDDIREAGLVGDRWTFRHQMGNAMVETLQYPEAAVGYSRDFLVRVAREAGFSTCEVRRGDPQSLLVCYKRP